GTFVARIDSTRSPPLCSAGTSRARPGDPPFAAGPFGTTSERPSTSPCLTNMRLMRQTSCFGDLLRPVCL
ncbi:hypothetical protein DPEC_G00285070, partial [Dallia pectoralis]